MLCSGLRVVTRTDHVARHVSPDAGGLCPVSRYVPSGNDNSKRPFVPVAAVNCWPAALRATTSPGNGSAWAASSVAMPPTRTSVPVTVWWGLDGPLQLDKISMLTTAAPMTQQTRFM
jgi:hypothetical protein